jgi:hypothetical protein
MLLKNHRGPAAMFPELIPVAVKRAEAICNDLSRSRSIQEIQAA